MTSQASQLLVDEILPLLTRNVPSAVYPQPGEDTGELIQDGVAIAADMMELMEKSGKLPIASSIAYYSIMRLRSGRRSYGSGSADVLSPQAQMAHRLTVTSLDAPLQTGGDDEGGELCLGDLLASRHDDPATEVCRRLDWDEFVAGQSARDVLLLRDLASGTRLIKTARRLKVSSPRITQIKGQLAAKIRNQMTDSILADSAAEPLWRHDLRAHAEKALTRDDDKGSSRASRHRFPLAA